jgi:hypothetical protein
MPKALQISPSRVVYDHSAAMKQIDEFQTTLPIKNRHTIMRNVCIWVALFVGGVGSIFALTWFLWSLTGAVCLLPVTILIAYLLYFLLSQDRYQPQDLYDNNTKWHVATEHRHILEIMVYKQDDAIAWLTDAQGLSFSVCVTTENDEHIVDTAYISCPGLICQRRTDITEPILDFSKNVLFIPYKHEPDELKD